MALCIKSFQDPNFLDQMLLQEWYKESPKNLLLKLHISEITQEDFSAKGYLITATHGKVRAESEEGNVRNQDKENLELDEE